MSKRDETLTGWIRDAIDRGVSNVEEIHKAIADLPLDVLERNGLLEEAAAGAREIQDRTIGAVYDVIREVNKRVSELVPNPGVPRRGEEA